MPVPQLKFYRALWGAESQFSTDINVLFAEIHRLGYSGVEATLFDIHRISKDDEDAFSRALQDNQLELVGLIQTNYPSVKDGTWQDLPVDQHVANIEYHLEEFQRYKPIHVNIQGGQDSWSIEEYEQFFEKALEVQAKYAPLTSSHEVSVVHCSLFSSNLIFLDSSKSCTLQSIYYCSDGQTFSKSSFNG
jgi:hypothetical protein